MMVRFLIPERKAWWEDNSIDAMLLDTYGGFTCPPRVGGVWRNPDTGELERDMSRVYEVALAPEQVPALDAYLAKLATQLGEHSIWRVVSQDVGECIKGA